MEKAFEGTWYPCFVFMVMVEESSSIIAFAYVGGEGGVIGRRVQARAREKNMCFILLLR